MEGMSCFVDKTICYFYVNSSVLCHAFHKIIILPYIFIVFMDIFAATYACLPISYCKNQDLNLKKKKKVFI